MKIVPATIAITLTTLFCASTLLAWQGRVSDVIDARTLLVDAGEREVRVFLYGLGVPEKNEPFGQEALDFLMDRALGRLVDVQRQSSKGSQIPAVVTVLESDLNLNEALLIQGLAWVWEAYCEKAVLCGRWERLQGQAKANGQGFWPLIPENRPPWKWLREQGRE